MIPDAPKTVLLVRIFDKDAKLISQYLFLQTSAEMDVSQLPQDAKYAIINTYERLT